jgi:hypothetical protein
MQTLQRSHHQVHGLHQQAQHKFNTSLPLVAAVAEAGAAVAAAAVSSQDLDSQSLQVQHIQSLSVLVVQEERNHILVVGLEQIVHSQE